jgi:RNA polymerase sigma-70 factor (ECF subfamily)
MAPSDRDELERRIRELCDAGDFDGATSAALRGYGTEIFAFLVSLLRSEPDAAEVFGAFSERVWKGIRRFGWESSFRTWAYTVARNAARTQRAGAKARAARFAALPEGSELAEIAEQIRTETRSYLKTRARDAMAKLRDSLAENERTLLTLRIDRNLSWQDLARVLHDGETPPSDAELERSSAQLRKRFQRLKARIVEMGLREGILKRRSAPD